MKFSGAECQRRRWPLRRPAAGLIRWRNIYNTAVTLYCKNAAITWWERLPAAIIAVAPFRRRLSRLVYDEPFGR